MEENWGVLEMVLWGFGGMGWRGGGVKGGGVLAVCGLGWDVGSIHCT